jgi:arylsulfatase A-like enzyme
MFERGTDGHETPMLYEPVIKIPLMILVPGSQIRQDFLTPTAGVDLLPTLLNIAKREIPSSCEGKLLPGLGGIDDPNRFIISMDAKESSAHQPFTKATYTIINGHYKLIYYNGYNHKYKEYFEFYDLQEDPEELSDKYSKPKFAPIVSELKEELLTSIKRANQKLVG